MCIDDTTATMKTFAGETCDVLLTSTSWLLSCLPNVNSGGDIYRAFSSGECDTSAYFGYQDNFVVERYL